ncbi:MAG: hypothetical protein OP8BY_0705 [Candidatus Saccharicenans subterraneus]|uniref:Uncharacterized protein n=1 Tax=Candidatus Saccharicenans subterraneus TaxID=2508984 RepID=A0A3E2BK61_9BACT|nr:MAG: hypothetical protein OP8BY_0705 [Candidatus Saccharicenans subterraneum]
METAVFIGLPGYPQGEKANRSSARVDGPEIKKNKRKKGSK